MYLWPDGCGVKHSRAPHAAAQEGLEFEMPGKSEITRAVRDGLDNLEIDDPKGDTEWTKAVKTKLCTIGREFGFKVGAGGVGNSDYGEWLYDVTWLEYEREHDDLKWPATALINAHWVAVCEWGRGKNFEFIIEEFEKLLLARLYGSAISGMKKEGILRRCCRHRPVQYWNNILEQDHRAIKRRVKAKQGFREFHAARRTIQGYEAMHMIRKGQASWVRRFGCSATDSVHQQAVRGGCMRRSLVDPTHRPLAAF